MSIQWKETLPAIVLDHAVKHPDKNAICIAKKAVTYSQLSDMIKNACGNLIGLGVKKGDRVVLSAVMKAEYIAAFLAVKCLRAIAVPVNRTDSQEMVSFVVDECEAKLFLSDNPKYQIGQKHSLNDICKPCENVKELDLPGEVNEDDITEILFTSGTTGKPKGAMLSQSGIKASIYNTSSGMDMRADDILLIPLPLNHSFGLRVLRSALSNGETIVLQNGFSFAKEMQDNIAYWKCNCMVAVNAGIEMIRQQMGTKYKEMLSGMRYIEFSAGAVPVKTREDLINDLPNVKLYNTWGSTETGGALFLCFSENPLKITSAGCAINDIEIRTVDESGNPIVNSDEKYGRLAIHSKACTLGYYKNEQLTEETLKNGWLLTNDAAKIDEDGYIYLNGRIDDIINVGGEKVAPSDIERIVEEIEGVQGCACCGVEDPKGVLGEVPILFIKTSCSIDEKIIEERLRSEGTASMVPIKIIEIDEFPRNYMGKLDRKALKEIWQKNRRSEAVESTDAGETTADVVLNNILTRRSIRNFTEQLVPQEMLDKILLAGRMAPSGHNMQTWRFTVLRKRDTIERLKVTNQNVAKEKNTLVYGFLNPQVCIIVSNDVRNYTAALDSAAAMENMLLMSHALGLGGTWLNSLYAISDEPEIRKLLNEYGIPETHRVYGILALGYPSEKNVKTPVKKENVIFYYD